MSEESASSCLANVKSGSSRPPVHPNAKLIIRAIVADDVAGYCRELRVMQPIDSQNFGHGFRCSNGEIRSDDATAEEEELTARYVLLDTGSNAAHVAAANDAFNVLNFILRMQIVDLRNSRTFDTQWTPLHFGALNQAERVCALLRSVGADLYLEDAYGDKPFDIANALHNRGLADRLGDTTNSVEENAKKNEAYQKLLAQARRFEEERANDLAEKQRREEEQALVRRQQQEAAEERRALKRKFEQQRLAYIRERWWGARQTLIREFIADQYRLFVERVGVVMPKSLERAKQQEAARLAEEHAAAQRSSSSAKKGSKNGKKGRSAKPQRAASLGAPDDSTLVPTAAALTVAGEDALDVLSPSFDPVAYAMALVDAELPMPDLSDRASKEEKKDHAKLRTKILKERKIRKDQELARLRRMQDDHAVEQDKLEAENALSRLDIEQAWYTGFAALTQHDPGADRKHTGWFRFEPFDQRYSWSCCGQPDDPFAPGCLPGEDTLRPRLHTGLFSFHMVDCGCGGVKVNAVTGRATVADLRRRSLNASAASFADQKTSSRQSRNQRRVGPHEKLFCNPGGCCWSCCGATGERDSGCTPPFRFLFTQHCLCDVRFFPVVDDSPEDGCRTIVVTTADRSASQERPQSPQEARSLLLEERSQAIAASVLTTEQDVESNVHVGFIVGANGALALQTDEEQELLSYDEMERERLRYAHASNAPEPPYVVTAHNRVRLSQKGRRMEHLTPPVLQRTAVAHRRGPAATTLHGARVTRINLLANLVFQTDFLADAKRQRCKQGHRSSGGFSASTMLDTSDAILLATDSDTDEEDRWVPGVRPQNSFFFQKPTLVHRGLATDASARKEELHEDCLAEVLSDFGYPKSIADVVPVSFAPEGGERRGVYTGEFAAYGFELRLVCCPRPTTVADERAVIGLVLADVDDSDSDDDQGCDADADHQIVQTRDTSPVSEDGGDILPQLHNTSPSRGDNVSHVSLTAAARSNSVVSFGGIDDEFPADVASGGVSPRLIDAAGAAAAYARKKAHRASAVSFSVDSFANNNNSKAADQDGASRQSDRTSVPRSRRRSVFGVPESTRRYFAKEDRYISGPFGIGWWAHTSSIRGLGQQVDVGAENVLSEGDLVLFLVDGVNHALHIFHNRSFVTSIRIDTSVAYVPAVTLVAGCRFDVEFFGHTSLAYVTKWWEERALSERMLRLTTDTKHMDARLAAAENAKKQASTRGGNGLKQRAQSGMFGSMASIRRSQNSNLSTSTQGDDDSEILF